MGDMRFYPFNSGKYEVKPGLRQMDLAKEKVLLFDDQFPHYRKNKEECRAEKLGKYFQTKKLHPATEKEAIFFIVKRLLEEYPALFSVDGGRLSCTATNESFSFSEPLSLEPGLYNSPLDALAMQLMEDMAIWQLADGSDWLAAIHLCAPNHWAAEDKVGRNFSEVHFPVAGMDRLRKHYRPMLDSLVQKGSTVERFAWGIGTDQYLNHHPEPAPGHDPAIWAGRAFDLQNPSLFARVERQTLTGLKTAKALLFTIRTFHYPVAGLPSKAIIGLYHALETMPPASQEYKGLVDSRDEILKWMEGLIGER